MYRIYTRTGDKGTTALYGGSRIEKDHIRVEAYGTVDELISQLGVCYATTRDAGLRESLHHIQQTLFVLGAELASDARGLTRLSQTVGEEEITALERLIDRNMAESGPLKQFVIPGRNLASAQLHVARNPVPSARTPADGHGPRASAARRAQTLQQSPVGCPVLHGAYRGD
ncbi:cob(I)alamin adenosyltransferase PduO [Klebsiella pneumoniae]|uniref:Corrinoid adenosyltransferase n=1 Tax=Klebsiella pneumoniae TaxID=573 RepID=A0A377XJM6_KLEPN|nr:cob(I)alamin adenosyltransferase PduO [Klebsiella pneumoniae]